jgi:hypothetical protein
MKVSTKVTLLIIIFIQLINYAQALSIGVSPGKVNFQNMLKGGYAEKTVTISTNSDQELTGHFDVSGEISEWIRFEPNTTTITLSKTDPYKLRIIAEPPQDVRNGSYSGSITIVTDSFGNITGRAGGFIKAAVTLIINLGVTNQEISKCRAGGFNFKDSEIGYPIELELTIINDGNVRIKPIISVDIWDQMQEDLLLSKELVSDEILPTTESKVLRSLQNNLDIGQYWVSVGVDECGASDFLTFSVVEKGAIADKGILKQITNKVWAYVGETIQINAVFQNIGERKVFARFKGVIKLDDKIVKVIETEELDVLAGETTTFDIYFTPEKPGRYTLTGRVIYNKKLTFEKGSIINVNPAPVIPKEKGFAGYLPLVLYVTIIITIIFIIRKIMKEKRNKIYK